MSKEVTTYKYLTVFTAAFVACYLTQAVLLNRLVSLGHFYITGGTFIYFISPLISDVVAEVYGYRIARQLIWLGLFSVIFLTLCIDLFTHLPAPVFWVKTDHAYSLALSSLFRSTVVGVVAILVGQFVNIYLISKSKVLLRGRYFWLRSVGSSIVGDLLTVSIAIFFIFFSRAPGHQILKILVPELIIMVVFSALGAIPALFISSYVAKKEGIKVFDVGVDFNPFKFNSDK